MALHETSYDARGDLKGHAKIIDRKTAVLREGFCRGFSYKGRSIESGGIAGVYTFLPPINVLKPNNIILAQIRPRLNLDHLEGHTPGIFQSVTRA
jgi:hypothetical protein